MMATERSIVTRAMPSEMRYLRCDFHKTHIAEIAKESGKRYDESEKPARKSTEESI